MTRDFGLTSQIGGIGGWVFREDGTTPFPNVAIVAWSSQVHSSGHSVSDQQGKYLTEGLAPGNDYPLTLCGYGRGLCA